MMNPMMMMMLPHIMGQGSTSQNPMSGLLMATLMKKMSSSSSDQYDYDDYDYDYEYDYASNEGSDDYDYEYQYADDSSPSPLSSIIQQMLQQRLAATHEPVQMSTSPSAEVEEIDASSSLEFPEQDSTPEAPAQRTTVEIAQPPRRSEKEIRSGEQVSYRNAP